jgi:hypothetical protein
LQDFGNTTHGSIRSSRAIGRSQKGLGKGKPELERKAGQGSKAGVDGSWVDSGTKSEVREAGRALGEVGGDGFGDGGADIITETERFEVINREKSGTDRLADVSGFKGSIVGATGNVAEGGDEFGGAVKGGMLHKQISKEIETTGLEVGSGVNNRSRRNKKLNYICRTTENEASESRRR